MRMLCAYQNSTTVMPTLFVIVLCSRRKREPLVQSKLYYPGEGNFLILLI